MIHLKRILWLAAWSVWLWLGFGLYRELPRRSGPPPFALTLADDEIPISITTDPFVVVSIKENRGGNGVIRVVDPLSRRSSEFPGIGRWKYRRAPHWTCNSGRMILSFRLLDKPSEPTTNLVVLDLENGIWRDLAINCRSDPIVHPTRPLALVFEDRSTVLGPGPVILVDLRNGNRLYRCPAESETSNVMRPDDAIFAGEDRVVIVGKELSSEGRSNEEAIEVLDLSSQILRPRRHSGISVQPPISACKVGRIAWRANPSRSREFVVYDAVAGHYVFNNVDPNASGHFGSGGIFTPDPIRLSDDGTTCLDSTDGSIWDLQKRAILWTCEPRLSIFQTNDDGSQFRIRRDESVTSLSEVGSFHTTEVWRIVAWGLDWSTTTYATRSASNGATKFRTWIPVKEHSQRWLADRKHNYYPSPPPVDWLLLVLCQTILALPLILLWAVLRWRRKRKMKTM